VGGLAATSGGKEGNEATLGWGGGKDFWDSPGTGLRPHRRLHRTPKGRIFSNRSLEEMGEEPVRMSSSCTLYLKKERRGVLPATQREKKIRGGKKRKKRRRPLHSKPVLGGSIVTTVLLVRKKKGDYASQRGEKKEGACLVLGRPFTI